MEVLGYGYNRFTGCFPEMLATVKRLAINNNYLSGTLPEEILVTESLEAFHNLFTGSIPNINTKNEIHLSDNQLSGTFPLLKVRNLYLDNNFHKALLKQAVT